MLSVPALLVAALLPLQQTVIYDDSGMPYALGEAPRRIISLAPNITEILFALGLGDKIAGVTRYCDYPEQALGKNKVGGMVDPNLELIQALRPDLIVGFRGNPLGVLNKLRRLHFPVFVLNLGTTLDGLFQTVETVGRITRAEEPAREIVDGLKKKQVAIQHALLGHPEKPKVFLSVYGQGLWTCGQGSYLNDLLTQAGGLNIAGKIERRWLQLSREQLIHEDPDVIVIMAKDKDRFAQAEASFWADPRLKGIRAVKDNNIHWLDENIAGRFGPRLFDALEAGTEHDREREVRGGGCR